MREICLEPKQQPTLKCHSRFTKKGKVMACKILFSFKVCSTCFNFTTFKFEANHQNYILFKSRLLIYYNTCYTTRLVPKSNVIIHVEWPTIANTAHQECSNLMYGTNVLKKARRFYTIAFVTCGFANTSTNRLCYTTYTVHFTIFWNSRATQ